MFQSLDRVGRLLSVSLLAAFAVGASGCPNNSALIDHVTFTPSDNLETVRVSLVFTNNVKSDLSGGFTIGDYGFLFVNPYTSAEPFEVGFSLNTSIVNDQNYIHLSPTTVLPNGVPIGIEYALVQIQSPTPISSKFDLYGYVDVLHANWLGAAAIFSFLNDQYFPAGLSISQVFLRDQQGDPGIIASVFGPTINPGDGTLKQAGGIALFANVRQLIEQHALVAGQSATFRAEPLPYVSGPAAREINGNFDKMRALEKNVVRGLNQSRNLP